MCINCIHFFYEHGIPKCKAFGYLNVYSNEIKFLPCITARSKDDLCGTNGLFWFGNAYVSPNTKSDSK